MNYELVEKLVKVEFPMEKFNVAVKTSAQGMTSGQLAFPKIQGGYLCPSLSNLIEECNPTLADDFGVTTSHLGGWEAYYMYIGYVEHNKKYLDDADDNFFHVDETQRGDSPEEAVAHLWLALNEK